MQDSSNTNKPDTFDKAAACVKKQEINSEVKVHAQNGWIFFDNKALQSEVSSTRGEPGGTEGQVEFRIPVKCTTENMRKVYDVLYKLFQEQEIALPFEMKIINPEELKTNNLDDWKPERGPFRDQRGKEICVYVTWNKDKTTSLTPDEYKQFMLVLAKRLVDAGVQGVGYHPSLTADRTFRHEPGFEAMYGHIFSYLEFDYTDKTVFKHSKEYEDKGYRNPLSEVVFTEQDYEKAGLQEHLLLIKRVQMLYLKEYLPKFEAHIKQGLQSVESSNDTWFERLTEACNELDALNKGQADQKDIKGKLGEINKILEEKDNSRIVNSLKGLVDSCYKSSNPNKGDLIKCTQVPEKIQEGAAKEAAELVKRLAEFRSKRGERAVPNIDTGKLIRFGCNDLEKLSKLNNAVKHANFSMDTLEAYYSSSKQIKDAITPVSKDEILKCLKQAKSSEDFAKQVTSIVSGVVEKHYSDSPNFAQMLLDDGKTTQEIYDAAETVYKLTEQGIKSDRDLRGALSNLFQKILSFLGMDEKSNIKNQGSEALIDAVAKSIKHANNQEREQAR